MNNINYQPLTDSKDDKLQFEKPCQQISNFINGFPNNQPYSIALFGNWGSGKSTMLNFIEQKLNNKNNIIIRFNPWQVLNDENLASTIFEEIAYVISNNKYVKLKNSLLEYGRKICVPSSKLLTKSYLISNGLDDTTSDAISDISSGVVDSLFSSDSQIPLSKRKANLESELLIWSTKEKKKIVIFVDEIDRLFPKEIVEIFKLIKATISFPSVIFVVAMDKLSVIDSLKSINISRPEEYLSKIFQQKFHLNSNLQLRTLYKELLLPLIETNFTDSKESLKLAIDATVFLKQEKFYYPVDKTKHLEVPQTYSEVYVQLSEYLSIPRSFTNYMAYVISNWNDYYRQLTKSELLNHRDSIAVFLIFTLSYINPELVENKSLGSRTKPEGSDYPLLFKAIRYKLLNLIYEEKRTMIEDKPNSYTISYDDVIIRRAIYTLKRYPDLKVYYDK